MTPRSLGPDSQHFNAAASVSAVFYAVVVVVLFVRAIRCNQICFDFFVFSLMVFVITDVAAAVVVADAAAAAAA
eukprot:12960560-Ditylum_brightwellii.AAC.1